MPKQIPQNELDAIVDIVTLFPQGISIGEIMDALAIPISRRNVQHRLAFLVRKGCLYAEGNARARLYRIPSKDENDNHTSAEDRNESIIPLSAISENIQRKILQPIQARIPVSYNWEFLDKYRPNVTSYLSDPIRLQLFEIGNTDGERPAGTYARQIFNRLLIDLSWNSSRLEGNTYSLLETERLLKLSEVVDSKDLKEARMILNHKDAIEFLIDSAPNIGINRHTILNLHALLSNDLISDLEACGRLRSIAVGIRKSVYQPLAMPQLIEEYFQQILDTANAIENPFEQAFFLMVHLPYLQPFEDVNKRVSRLAANIPLIKHNLCPLSFVDVPQKIYVNGLLGIYELNRIELLRDVFVWAYKRSCLRYTAKRKELGDPDPFRLRYRSLITEIVAKIVREHMDKTAAIATIRIYAQRDVSSEDQAHFIEAVEKDLMSLHEGNIARHRLQLSEYIAWQKMWQ